MSRPLLLPTGEVLEPRGRYIPSGDQQTIVRVAQPQDREQIIGIINMVAGERRYLQTDRYLPTPAWEQVLRQGSNAEAGLLLLVVEVDHQIVGFGRLSPDGDHPPGRSVGSLGMAILPTFRSQGIGSILLDTLMASAPLMGFRKLSAAILASNRHSQNLFRKYGFDLLGRRRIRVPFKKDPVEELLVEVDLVQ